MYRMLEGLTVVEAASFIAAPSAALHLAQLGAEVIRIDPIGGGPDARRWPLSIGGESLYWEGLNKGKRSIAVDYSRPAGRELVQRLATAGDGLFVTNMPHDGFLSYERLAELRADLVCLRIMGWPDGTPAVDYTVAAAVGVPLITGHADDPRPVNSVLPSWDLLAGAYGAFALLAAERERRTSGRGRELRLALSDIAVATLGHLGMVQEAICTGDRPRGGNDLFGAFGRDFITADGARLMTVAITRRQWVGLVSALEIAERVAAVEAQHGVRFDADEGVRYAHREVLNALVETAVAGRTADECAAAFDANGVCWSRYRGLADAIAADPRLVSGNPVMAAVEHPSGHYPTPGAPVLSPGEERAIPIAAPRLGQDADGVLVRLLGLPESEIAALRDAGVVA